MLHIQWKKTSYLKSIAFVFCFFLALSASAQKQIYMEEHDAKRIYFGISLGGNRSTFHADLHTNFLDQDTVLTAEPMNTGGFNLGLSATARLSPRWAVRFNPQLIFLDRVIHYSLAHPDYDGYQIDKKVESVITTFPLQLKFISDRIGNFRVYMLGGGKFDVDLASNAQARKAEDMIKIQRFDYGFEAGFGFNFYHKSFILSPEIKISNGLKNLHDRNPDLKYSRALDEIRSRMIMFTIHLEG